MTDFTTMRTICFTGPRPKNLFGYKNKKEYQKIVDCIQDFLLGFCKVDSNETLSIITGGAQGFDQLVFWAANNLKKQYHLKNEVYIPFVGQEDLWNETGLFGKKEYQKMLSLADKIVDVSKERNLNITTDKEKVLALLERNKAMVDDSKLLVGFYSLDKDYRKDRSSGTASCLRYAADKIPICLIDPKSHMLEFRPCQK